MANTTTKEIAPCGACGAKLLLFWSVTTEPATVEEELTIGLCPRSPTGRMWTEDEEALAEAARGRFVSRGRRSRRGCSPTQGPRNGPGAHAPTRKELKALPAGFPNVTHRAGQVPAHRFRTKGDTL